MTVDKPWKRFERDVAELIGGKRAWANAGGGVDCASERFVAQCKLVTRLSLEELTALVEAIGMEADRAAVKATHDVMGLVCVKVKRGRGFPSPTLVVMSDQTFKRLITTQ